jgi:hypothetical protein
MPFRRPQTANGAFCRPFAPCAPVTRRFPLPWIVEEHADSFIVHDATGQPLA